MRKKLLTMCFVLAAMLSLMTVTASAVEVSDVEGLRTAIKEATDGETITLTKRIPEVNDANVNIDIPSPASDPEAGTLTNLIIDLNGQTLALGSGSIIVDGVNLNLTITGGSKGGSITSSSSQTIEVKQSNVTISGTTILNAGNGYGVDITDASGSLNMISGVIEADTAIHRTFTTSKVNIVSGIFSSSPDSFLKEGKSIKFGSKYLVPSANDPKTIEAIVEHKDQDSGATTYTPYSTLQGAVGDVGTEKTKTVDGDIVWLVKDIGEEKNPIKEDIEITKGITLEMDGHSITLGLKDRVEQIMSTLIVNVAAPETAVTIKGGTSSTIKQNRSSNDSNPDKKLSTAVRVAAGNVTINVANIEGSDYGVEVTSSGKLTVKGGKIKGHTSGIEINKEAISRTGKDYTLTVEGGTIEGDTNGINIQAGTLVVVGGKITGHTGAGISVSGNTTVSIVSEISNDDNASITVSGHNALYFDTSKGTISAKVSNGTFTAEGGKSVVVEGNEEGENKENLFKNFIYGGKYVNQAGQKDPLNVDYLVADAFQETDGTVKWPRKVVTITFDAGANIVKAGVERYTKTRILLNEDGEGKLSELPAGPESDGYKFVGWYTIEFDAEKDEDEDLEKIKDKKVTTDTVFKENTTVYAHWKKLFTITLEANGGVFEDNKDTKTLQIEKGGTLDEMPELTEATRKGHGLLAWYIAGTDGNATEEEFKKGEDGKYHFNGSMTLIAKWGLSVTFDAGAGEVLDKDGKSTEKSTLTLIASADAESEEGASLADQWPSAKREGWHFDGWYVKDKTAEKGEKEVDETTDFKQYFDKEKDTISVYAKWSPEINVTLEADKYVLVADHGEQAITLTIQTKDAHFVLPESGNKIDGETAQKYFDLTFSSGGNTTGDDWLGQIKEVEFIKPDPSTDTDEDAEPVITQVKIVLGPKATDVEEDWQLSDKPGTLTITVKDEAFKEHLWGGKGVSVPQITVAYEITFHGNGSKFAGKTETKTLYTDASGKLSKEDVKRLLPDLVRDNDTDNDTSNYKYYDWYTRTGDEVAGYEYEKFDFEKPFGESTKLYARWGIQVTFNPYNTEDVFIVVTDDSNKIKEGEWPKEPKYEGHFFAGWFFGDENGECPIDGVLKKPIKPSEGDGTGGDVTDGDGKDDQKPVADTQISEDQYYTFEFKKDTILHAHWIKRHTITFNPNGGAFDEDEDVDKDGCTTRLTNENFQLKTVKEEEEKSVLPQKPSRDGYEFIGWYFKRIDDGELAQEKDVTAVDENTEFEGSVTVYAYWEVAKGARTIIFNPNGGSFGNSSERRRDTEENGKLPEKNWPDEPTFEGHEFLGWYTEAQGGDLVAARGKPNGTYFFAKPTTLYAHWSYTITFDPNGGEFGADEKVDEKTKTTTRTTNGDFLVTDWPTKLTHPDGYEFVGWYTRTGEKEDEYEYQKVDEKKKFYENTTLYAQWQDKVTLTADPSVLLVDEGTESKPVTITLTVDGTTFKVSEDVDDKEFASYFKVTFSAEGGETEITDVKRSATDKTKVEVTLSKAPSKVGKLTITVDTDAFAADLKEARSVDIAVKAPVAWTITFDPNGGKFGDDVDGVGTDGSLKVPTNGYGILEAAKWPKDPTRDGYTFKEWNTKKDGTGTAVTKDTGYTFKDHTTVYAQWTKKEVPPAIYTITFDANGGTVTPTSAQTGADGKLTTLPTPLRSGFDFKEWNTKKDGTGTTVTTSTVFTGPSTIYAQWTVQSDDPGGSDPGGDEPGTDEPEDETTYSIRLNAGRNGTATANYKIAKSGTSVIITASPDSDYSVERIRVYLNDGSVYSQNWGSSRHTFSMPPSNVTVEVTFSLRREYNNFIPPQTQTQTSAQTSLPTSAFTPVIRRPSVTMWDVPTNSWAYSAAQWAYQNGYLDLAADRTFRINDTVSHIQLWRIMARWQGETALDDNSVTLWARRTGAYSIGAATGAMTRQNMVEYLYQCYFLMGGNVSVTGNLTQYHDSQMIVSPSARNAWIWAVNKGIISGTPDGFLTPNKTLTRAEFASILMRLCQKG